MAWAREAKDSPPPPPPFVFQAGSCFGPWSVIRLKAPISVLPDAEGVAHGAGERGWLYLALGERAGLLVQGPGLLEAFLRALSGGEFGVDPGLQRCTELAGHRVRREALDGVPERAGGRVRVVVLAELQAPVTVQHDLRGAVPADGQEGPGGLHLGG